VLGKNGRISRSNLSEEVCQSSERPEDQDTRTLGR
jgi:hypothetical protein